MKKFLYIAATALLLASCTEDFKDWAEPQSNPQDEVITFGNGSVTPVSIIDFAEQTGERVKVCDITAPSTSDTAYHAQYTIFLNDQAFFLGEDGTINAQELKDYIINLYGKAPEPRVLDAKVEWLMTNGITSTSGAQWIQVIWRRKACFLATNDAGDTGRGRSARRARSPGKV